VILDIYSNFSSKKGILSQPKTEKFFNFYLYFAFGNLLLSIVTKVGKNTLEKILVILTVFHILIMNTEAVPPSLKLVFPYLQTAYHL